MRTFAFGIASLACVCVNGQETPLQLSTASYERTPLLGSRQYGYDLAMNANWIVIGEGASNGDNPTHFEIFARSGDGTSNVLSQSFDDKGGSGIAIARESNRIISTHPDHVYVFDESGGTWAENVGFHDATFVETAVIGHQSMPSQYAAISDDGSRWVIGRSTRKEIKIYHDDGYTKTFSKAGADTYARHVAMSPDGNRIVTCSTSSPIACFVYEWNGVNDWSEVTSFGQQDTGTYPNNGYFGSAASFGASNSEIIVTSAAGSVQSYFQVYKETTPNTWDIQQTIAFTDYAATERFAGLSLSYHNGIAAIGVPEASLKSQRVSSLYQGYVILLHRINDSYVVQGNLEDTNLYEHTSNNVFNSRIGKSIAVYGTSIIVGGSYYSEQSLLAGKVISFESVPGAPPPPTLAPTLSPTPDPGFVVGTASVGLSGTNATEVGTATTTLITDIKGQYAESEITVAGSDRITLPEAVLNAGTEADVKAAIRAARSCPTCTVTFETTGARRALQGGGEFDVVLGFDLDQAAYETLINSGNNLDSPAFISSLSTDLGVPEENISVTLVGSTVTVTVGIIETPGAEPSNEDTVAQLSALKSALDTSASTVIAEVGGGSVQSQSIDYCPASRTCNGRGTCDPETGICDCAGDFWGVNCETAASCSNGGTVNNKLCQCPYPYWGTTCQNTKDCVTCA